MRAVTFLLHLVYAYGLSGTDGDTCTSDICLLQLHSSNAAKIRSETKSTDDDKAHGTDTKDYIHYPERNDNIGKGLTSESVFQEQGGKISVGGFTKSVGESHAKLSRVLSVPATDSFHSDKCQRFYLEPAPPAGYPWPGAGAHDDAAKLFRPAAELSRGAAGPRGGGPVKTWPEVEFKRMVTYEDVATPVDYHGFIRIPKHNHCMHYAVRTPQRPVKTMAGTGSNGRSFAMPAVWKSGSTSFNMMLQKSIADFHREHSDNGRNSSCEGPFELQQCEKHSSFDSSGAELMFAAVRNPLDRFISSVKEHKEFSTCDGQACEEDVQLGRSTAARLLAEFPYSWSSCEHATQSYLLSGTDMYGKPMIFQRIIRLESLEEGLHDIGSMLDQTFVMQHHNSKAAEAKQLLYDAVFSDPKTLCAICKVYAQDFECFGYAMPENCTEERCASVGVTLKYSS